MSNSPWGPPVGAGFPNNVFPDKESVGFGLGLIVIVWIGAYLASAILTVVVAAIFGADNISGDAAPTWGFALAAAAMWLPSMAMLAIVAKRGASTHFAQEFSLSFKVGDLAGIPIGVVSQIFLVGIVTWPFQQMFPDAFANSKLDERATNLVGNAAGAWIVLLGVVVVFGAPIVEELVFRGFIQGSLQKRFRHGTALLVTAVWFTLIHFNPIEFPGLFAFALVLGWCFKKTQRLGLSIWAHLAFNATALVLVSIR